MLIKIDSINNGGSGGLMCRKVYDQVWNWLLSHLSCLKLYVLLFNLFGKRTIKSDKDFNNGLCTN